jgi:6,7-dimethyl-8-ribityllumazine synthase
MKIAIDTSRLPKVPDARIVVLKSKWYAEYTDALAEACIEVLRRCDVAQPEVHTLPGALELPLAAQLLLAEARTANRPIDAVICFAIVLKGATHHFELVLDETARGLGEVSRAFSTPIVIEVIPALRIEDAIERCKPDEFNKGIEAAAAAVEFIAWRAPLGGAQPARIGDAYRQ